MKKDLLKLIVTVAFGLLLIGCGSSGKKISLTSSVVTPTPTATATARPTATPATDTNLTDTNSTDNNDSNSSVITDTSDPLPF